MSDAVSQRGALDRRRLIGAAGVAGASAAMPGTSLAGVLARRANDTKIHTRFVDFTDPVEEFEAHFRMERDLVARQGTALTWYYWTVYMIPLERSPLPLLRYEGTEYSYFRKVADHTYRIHAHNISVPMTVAGDSYIDSLVNPITGKRVAVPTNLLLNDPGTVHSPKGFRNMNGDGTYQQPFRRFRIENGLMKLDSVRTAPPNWPLNHIESSIQEVPLELFNDKRITGLPGTSTGLYVFPYPKWLDMGDRPGHLLGYWDSWKIKRVEDFPDRFLAKLRRDHPELLQPRWSEFDRPAPFAY
jgi:hypothetical protein